MEHPIFQAWINITAVYFLKTKHKTFRVRDILNIYSDDFAPGVGRRCSNQNRNTIGHFKKWNTSPKHLPTIVNQGSHRIIKRLNRSAIITKCLICLTHPFLTQTYCIRFDSKCLISFNVRYILHYIHHKLRMAIITLTMKNYMNRWTKIKSNREE